MALIDEKSPTDCDAGRLRAEDFPRKELPALATLREKRYQVAILQSVLDDIHAHGQATNDIEICGVLLGTVYHDSKGPWCLIDASVRGNFSAGKQTQVTITSETWTHVNEVRDRQFPEKKFVGWYHTHPGFGIFLSGMDDFIQANWFAEPWQIALVYDPKSREDGVFIWREGKTINEPFLVVPDNGSAARSAGDETNVAARDMKVPSGTLGELMSRLQAAEQRLRWMMVALGAVGLIALVWPLMVFLFIGGVALHPASKSVDPADHDPGALPAAVRPPTSQKL
jgi:proteasome lid subunit RPN8/RPN11